MLTNNDDFESLLFGNETNKQKDDSASFDDLLFASDKAKKKSEMTHYATPAQIRAGYIGDQIGEIVSDDSGMKDFWTRARLGFQDTPSERQAIFKKMFPEGDLKYAPSPSGQMVELFRKSPNDVWKETDKSITFGPEVGDIADWSGAAPEVIGEALGGKGMKTLALRGPRVAGEVAGAMLGEATKQGYQYLTGTQRETPQEQMWRMGLTGLATYGGNKIGAGITGSLNIANGAGVSVPSEMQKIQKIAKDRGWSELIAPQSSSSPLVKRLAGQSAAVSNKIPDYLRTQEDDVVEALNAVRDTQAAGLLANSLSTAYDAEKGRILAGGLPNSLVSWKRSGEALQEGVKRYDKLARIRVDGKYDAARAIETPQFDGTELVKWAKEQVAPVPYAMPNGKVGFRKPDMPEPVRKNLEVIANMDPSLPQMQITLKDGRTVDVDSFKFLEDMRRELFDYKNPNPGDIWKQTEHGAASEAYRRIEDTIYNPQNSNPEFVKAWKDARSAARDRFDTLDKAWIRRVLKADPAGTESYSQLANNLVQPGMSEQVTFLRSVMKPDDYTKFQSGVTSQWLSAPEELSAKLAKFDDQTLNAIFDKSRANSFKKIAKSFEELQGVGIQEALAKQNDAGKLVQELVMRNDGASIQKLQKMLPPSSPGGKAIRASIFDMAFDRSVTDNAGRLTVDHKKLGSFIEELRHSGAIKFLQPDEVLFLEDTKHYTDAIKSLSVDSGASLQAATMAANIRRLDPAGLRTFAEAYGTGRLFTSGLGQRMISGVGKRKMDDLWVSQVAELFAQTSKDALVFSQDANEYGAKQPVEQN